MGEIVQYFSLQHTLSVVMLILGGVAAAVHLGLIIYVQITNRAGKRRKKMKRILAILLTAALFLLLCGCTKKEDSIISGNRFVAVEHNLEEVNKYGNCILWDRGTNVLYLVVYGGGGRIAITVLYEADGTPMTIENWRAAG